MYVRWSRTSGYVLTLFVRLSILLTSTKIERYGAVLVLDLYRVRLEPATAHISTWATNRPLLPRTYDLPFFLDVGNGPSYNFTIPFAPGTEVSFHSLNSCTKLLTAVADAYVHGAQLLKVSHQRVDLYI